MNELPIWPPLVALAMGLVYFGYIRWDSRRFDRRYGKRRL